MTSIFYTSVANTFKLNTVIQNSVLDVIDITKGEKTAGAANTWTENACVAANPSGLCRIRI